jgi:outer membrane protein TolC
MSEVFHVRGVIMAYFKDFSRGAAAAAAVVGFFLCIPAAAQDKTPAGPLKRVFYENYRPPLIRSIDVPGDASLEAMIQDGRLTLTDEDAVRLALQNNVDINVERYTPYFNVWGIEKGRAVLNPSIAANVSLDRLRTPTTSALQGGDTLLNVNTLYDVSFRKPFEPGLDLALGFNTRRLRTTSFFNSLNPSLVSTLSLSLTQHLLKDFGKLSRARYVLTAKNSEDMSREVFISRVQQLVTNVLNTYWDLVFSDEDIKDKETSRNLAQLVLDQNKIQAEVGSMSPLDVVQAEAEVAARDQQLITARYNRLIIEEQLKKLISSRADPGMLPATIAPVSKPGSPPLPVTGVTEAIQRAMEIRPEVRQLLSDLQNKKIQVDYTHNQLKPTLDLVASYSQNGLGGDRIVRDYSQGFIGAPIIGFFPGGFMDTLDSLFSQKYVGYNVGFSFKVPIGNDEARANNAQAQIDYRQAQERLVATRQRIAVEVRQAYRRIELYQASVTAAEVTVRSMRERLQGEQEKYALGATTTRAVIEAQRDLQIAVNSRLQNQINLIKSRISLDQAIGDTLSSRGIEVEEALRINK